MIGWIRKTAFHSVGVEGDPPSESCSNLLKKVIDDSSHELVTVCRFFLISLKNCLPQSGASEIGPHGSHVAVTGLHQKGCGHGSESLAARGIQDTELDAQQLAKQLACSAAFLQRERWSVTLLDPRSRGSLIQGMQTSPVKLEIAEDCDTHLQPMSEIISPAGGRGAHRPDVHAIDQHAGHAEGGALLVDEGLLFAHIRRPRGPQVAHADGPQVVLHHEHTRQLVQRRHVQALVELPCEHPSAEQPFLPGLLLAAAIMWQPAVMAIDRLFVHACNCVVVLGPATWSLRSSTQPARLAGCSINAEEMTWARELRVNFAALVTSSAQTSRALLFRGGKGSWVASLPRILRKGLSTCGGAPVCPSAHFCVMHNLSVSVT